MIVLLILVVSEILAFLVLRQHFKGFSKTRYYLSSVINAILSGFLWIVYIEVRSFTGEFDDPGHVWLMMTLNGAYCSILAPRVLLIILHFGGKAVRNVKGEHIRWLTDTGIIIWIVVLITISAGTLKGKYNFRTEEVLIRSEKMNKTEDTLTIIHISDLHLATFHRDKDKLLGVMRTINSLDPDIIINSGDYISYGWKEFGRFDTILAVAGARFGKFAVQGNHDAGTYHPGYDDAGRDTHITRLSELIESSGYTLLNDTNTIIKTGNAAIGIAGVITRGRRLDITYGDPVKSMAGLDSTDFNILISHDPNHWEREIAGKTSADLTLAGHTHGMQAGIITKRFRWSPAVLIFPRWNGLHRSGDQYLYINRGLGVLSVPFRIGMPPEITVIYLTGENINK